MLPAVTPESDRVIGGRYRLREQLGHGGMGVVWLAKDELLDRTVALKEVVASHGASEDVRERMLREARAAARLDHPGAVRIYDVVDEDDHSTPPWIVMEVLTGRTLKDAVNADGPLSPRRVAEIGVALVDAIAAAHRAGILHRDVKPGNVQLCEDGRVVLTDFGIASIAGDSSITRTGDIVGSPAYMSPERARGEQLGPKSDLFALGATMYAAVEGVPPFERETPLATLTAVVNDEPRPSHNAGALAPVIHGLLIKDPEQRLGVDDARARLLAIAHGTDPSETASWSPVARHDETRTMRGLSPAAATKEPKPTHRPQRRTVGVAVAVVLLVAGAAGLAAWLSSGSHSSHGSGINNPASGGPFAPGQDSVPADWETHAASAGWSVATPQGWATQQDGSFTRYKRPASEGSAYIAVAPESGTSPSDVLDTFAHSFASHPSYHEVSRTTTTFRGAGLPLLTVTYESQGAALEASFLALPAHGQVYILWWQTLTSGWDAAQPLRAKVISTFRAPT
jgi:serine/threonine protein kinase